MRLSICRTIAVLCALSIGILTVTPFVLTTEADSYWAEIDFYIEIESCDLGFTHREILKETDPRIARIHEPETHDPSEHSMVYNYYYSRSTVKCDGRDHGGRGGLRYTWG